MTTVLSLLFSPLGRALLIALALLTGGSGLYLKGRIDDHRAYTAQLQKEAADAEAKAHAARSVADKKFTDGKFNNRPGRFIPKRVRHGTDGFARD